MSTHRCKELLEHNKNYKFGSPMCIKYGYQFNNPYNKKNGNYKGWWLNYLEGSSEGWDIKYMMPIGVVDYCPFCGVKLNNVE